MEDKRKVVMFIATSLDGYIATKNDNLDWLFNVEGEGDNGYSEFYETVDTVLLGKRTYDWIIDQEGEGFPYQEKECFVFTKTKTDKTQNATFINEDVGDFIKNLKSQEGKNIWLVGGGELIHSFIKENIVDEFIITVAPVLIGEGIPLFKESGYHRELYLTSTRRFNQFVALHYEVRN